MESKHELCFTERHSQADDTEGRPRVTRSSLPHELVHRLETAADEDVDRILFPDHVNDDIAGGSDEISGQGRLEVRKRQELGEERRRETTEVKESRSDGLRPLENYVSLDTRGDFELFCSVKLVQNHC